MEILPIEKDLSISEDLLLTEIGFVGPQNGSIQILAGHELAETLAENVACSNLALMGGLWGWNGRTQVNGCHYRLNGLAA